MVRSPESDRESNEPCGKGRNKGPVEAGFLWELQECGGEANGGGAPVATSPSPTPGTGRGGAGPVVVIVVIIPQRK